MNEDFGPKGVCRVNYLFSYTFFDFLLCVLLDTMQVQNLGGGKKTFVVSHKIISHNHYHGYDPHLHCLGPDRVLLPTNE